MNPAELAQPFAEEMMRQGLLDGDDSSKQEEDQLRVLEDMAYILGLLDKAYFVRAGRAYITPDIPGTDRPKRVAESLEFTGNLLTYSSVRIPRLFGYGAIATVCLTFENVRIMPEFTNDDSMIQVSPFAVGSITDMEPRNGRL